MGTGFHGYRASCGGDACVSSQALANCPNRRRPQLRARPAVGGGGPDLPAERAAGGAHAADRPHQPAGGAGGALDRAARLPAPCARAGRLCGRVGARGAGHLGCAGRVVRVAPGQPAGQQRARAASSRGAVHQEAPAWRGPLRTLLPSDPPHMRPRPQPGRQPPPTHPPLRASRPQVPAEAHQAVLPAPPVAEAARAVHQPPRVLRRVHAGRAEPRGPAHHRGRGALQPLHQRAVQVGGGRWWVVGPSAAGECCCRCCRCWVPLAGGGSLTRGWHTHTALPPRSPRASYTFKPLLDVALFTRSLSRSMGYRRQFALYGAGQRGVAARGQAQPARRRSAARKVGALSADLLSQPTLPPPHHPPPGYYFACAQVLRWTSPPLSLMAAQEAALTGQFRSAHQRLVASAEEVAVSGEGSGASVGGHSRSRLAVCTLIRWMNKRLRLRSLPTPRACLGCSSTIRPRASRTRCCCEQGCLGGSSLAGCRLLAHLCLLLCSAPVACPCLLTTAPRPPPPSLAAQQPAPVPPAAPLAPVGLPAVCAAGAGRLLHQGTEGAPPPLPSTAAAAAATACRCCCCLVCLVLAAQLFQPPNYPSPNPGPTPHRSTAPPPSRCYCTRRRCTGAARGSTAPARRARARPRQTTCRPCACCRTRPSEGAGRGWRQWWARARRVGRGGPGGGCSGPGRGEAAGTPAFTHSPFARASPSPPRPQPSGVSASWCWCTSVWPPWRAAPRASASCSSASAACPAPTRRAPCGSCTCGVCTWGAAGACAGVGGCVGSSVARQCCLCCEAPLHGHPAPALPPHTPPHTPFSRSNVSSSGQLLPASSSAGALEPLPEPRRLEADVVRFHRGARGGLRASLPCGPA